MTEAEALALSRNFLTLEDVALIKDLCAHLPKPKRGERTIAVDCGAGSGTTALAVLEASNATVRTFDIERDAIYWAGAAVTNTGFADRWLGNVLTAVEAAYLFPEHNVDLLLLDTSHEYEATRDELRAWVPRIKQGGWLWCHDYAGDGGIEHNGVKQAVDEYLETHPTLFSERIEAGLGIALRIA